MQDRNRSYLLTAIALVSVLALVLAYFAGVASGRKNATNTYLTLEAKNLARMVATFTLTPTASATSSPTATGTPLPTATPSATPTSTATPASAEEWATRFQTLATNGLNAVPITEFDGERALALLRRTAQEQLLLFVPVSYHELSAEPWAALVTPRTPDGKVLPVLFWREPNDRNRIRSQFLLQEFSGKGNALDYTTLVAGIDKGVLRSDAQGRGQVLLIERPGDKPLLPTYLLNQAQPADDFKLIWRSDQEPLWSIPTSGSQVNLVEVEGAALPDLDILAPIALQGDLRKQIGIPTIFVEQTPFARQWAMTRWTPAVGNDVAESAGDAIIGYRLASANLRSTPITALARLFELVRTGNVNDTTLYATRFDLFQQIANLEVDGPGIWVAVYLDADGQPVAGNDLTPNIRFFDNANRAHTYDAYFEQDDQGAYRLASLEPAQPYQTDLITPAPALPTFTVTPVRATVAPTTSITNTAATRAPISGTTNVTQTLDVTQTLNLSSAVAAAQNTAQSANSVLVATNTPLPPPTGTPTITPTPTVTPTPTITLTPTITNTPVPSATGTPTSTPPPTATPLPIPQIPADQAPPLTGVTFLREAARVRGGPNTDSITISSIENDAPVDIFGITEAGDWLLIRNKDVLGWLFRDLVTINGDSAGLPVYHADGTPLISPTATISPTPGAPTPVETPTPLVTPVIEAPTTEAVTENGPPPAPEAGELAMTVGGDKIPANPLLPLAVTTSDGRNLSIQVDKATVQMWGGLIGAVAAGWVPAPAELLWAGAQIYVTGQPASNDPKLFVATRVRIMGAPANLARAKVLTYPPLASAVSLDTAIGLIGSREQQGIYLLQDGGTVQQLWAKEQDAAWVSGDDTAGILISVPDVPTGINTFSWVRTDGSGLQLFAQPFFRIRGVAGDAYGGLWWIETAQASLDQWQLWHYDPAQAKIVLRLQAAGELFSTSSRIVKSSLTPVLLAARPELASAQNPTATVTLFLDTLDNASQELYKGVFRLSMQNNGDGRGALIGSPQLLLAPEDYRGPLQVSPDRGRLAYFYFNAQHASLTSGTIHPPNTVRLLTLEGRGASTIRAVYETENPVEFLAPNLSWQGNDRLYLALSRFAEGQVFGLDRFGVVAVQLPAPGSQSAGDIITSNYLLPDQQELRDFAPCRNGESTLLVIKAADGNLELARWDHTGKPKPLFALTPMLTRAFVCWRAP